jgi:hypothetical protein
MRFAILSLAAWISCLAAPLARADVVSATPGAFVLHAEQTVSVSPAQAWTKLVRVGDWWNSEHTYSGNSHNLSLDLRAGGCWCERWNGGAVEHARVLLVLNRDGVRTLRLNAPLGPLQEMAVNAILTFTVAPDHAGAKIRMTYRVSGDASLSLDQVGPGVNGVIMEQYGRLIRLVTSGSPG